MCLRDPRSTQNISSNMCFRVHAQHTHTHTYNMQLAYADYIKQTIMFICNVFFDPVYQNKSSKFNIIINGIMPISVRSKIRDTTTKENCVQVTMDININVWMDVPIDIIFIMDTLKTIVIGLNLNLKISIIEVIGCKNIHCGSDVVAS